MLFDNCAYSLPHPTEDRYQTALGFCLILTHECDVDTHNQRAFNEDVLVVPIVPLEDFCDEMDQHQGAGSWGGILPPIASGDVFRVMYLPPIPGHLAASQLPNGGLINFNKICTCPLRWFDKYQSKAICTLSARGLQRLDYKIENHLLRAKAAELPFSRG